MTTTTGRVRRRLSRERRWTTDWPTLQLLSRAEPDNAEARAAYEALRDELPAEMPDAFGTWPGAWQFEAGVPPRWRHPLAPELQCWYYADLAFQLYPDFAEELPARWRFLFENDLLADVARRLA